MSGTSADGVEAALISAGDLRSRKAGVSLIAHKSFPFPKPLKGRILRLSEISASSGIPRINSRSFLSPRPSNSLQLFQKSLYW